VNDRYIAPYINFQGRAREAFEFYHAILGGSLSLFAFDPASGAMKAAGPGDPIGHGRLVAGAVRIFGSDGNPAYPATLGDTIALNVTGSDRDGLTKVFAALAEGGTIGMPLTDAAWGTAGWLKDRFDINWNIDIDRARPGSDPPGP
jgi:PhnB protein